MTIPTMRSFIDQDRKFEAGEFDDVLSQCSLIHRVDGGDFVIDLVARRESTGIVSDYLLASYLVDKSTVLSLASFGGDK